MDVLITTCPLHLRRIGLTELTWRVVGYDTKQMRNDSLLYIKDTAAQAEATCKQLHPNFDVYYVQRVDDYT